MAQFKKYADTFDWNRGLMEDDWNDGQHLVVKLKNKSDKGVEFATTVKFGHAQPGGEHVVQAEEKIKAKFSECGGWEEEIKYKNNGKLTYEAKSDCLKGFEGLEDMQLTVDGEASSKEMGLPRVGLSLTNSSFIGKLNSSIHVQPVFKTQWAWRFHEKCPITIGSEAEVNHNFTNSKVSLLFAGSFPGTGVQYGSTTSGVHGGGVKFTGGKSTGYVQHDAGNNSSGAKINFDWETRKIKTTVGLKLVQDDHTWKFMFHDSGMARAALQWQLHKVCKATLNTSLDLGDVARGTHQELPWGATFEIKY